MSLSILVARILALAYLSVGIGILSCNIKLTDLISDFQSSPALTYLSGLFATIIGMLLIHQHNIWVKDWRVLITIIGWIALAKGIMLITIPQSITWFKGWYKNTRAWGLVILAMGLLFGYFGYIY